VEQVAWILEAILRHLSFFLGCLSKASYLCTVKQENNMEIVVIEKQTFEQLLSEMRQLASRVELLDQKSKDRRLSKWLNGEDVCELLHISERTLQTLRSLHKIGYAQIGHKFMYRPDEVELVKKQLSTYFNN
jgi:CRP-like cAMP-binding protein